MNDTFMQETDEEFSPLEVDKAKAKADWKDWVASGLPVVKWFTQTANKASEAEASAA